MGRDIRGLAALALSSLLAGCAATHAVVGPADALRLLEENRAASFRIDASDGHGSGVVISAEGGETFLLTCAHVVQGVKTVTITALDLSGDAKTVPASVVAIDDAEDLAVIKVAIGPMRSALIAKDDAVRPGDPVYNVGYPYNMGEVVGRGYVMQIGMTGAYFDGEKVREIRESLLADIPDGAGTSGSGVYLDRTGELVGLMQIAALRGEDPAGVRVKTLITAKRIRAFLDAKKIPYWTKTQ